MQSEDEILSIIKSLPSDLTARGSIDSAAAELRNQLAAKINYLIEQDFHSLVQLLYRIDINESKLKQVLNEQADTDAGSLIAEMIIQRQLQKAELKKQFKQQDDIPENEKW